MLALVLLFFVRVFVFVVLCFMVVVVLMCFFVFVHVRVCSFVCFCALQDSQLAELHLVSERARPKVRILCLHGYLQNSQVSWLAGLVGRSDRWVDAWVSGWLGG